jgi:hypothetical protein
MTAERPDPALRVTGGYGARRRRVERRVVFLTVLPDARCAGPVTGGPVEHGRTGVDDGVTRSTGTRAERGDPPLVERRDPPLDRGLTGRAGDDVALLGVRCHPQTR